MISLLNNIAALEAQNQLNVTQSKLQNTLFQLSSGSRINSGADDAAGLAIANGLQANITALTQSGQNANSGVGQLQVADGALAQVTTLLNRAVTLATESASGTVANSQRGALDAEYTQIKAEIDSIGSNTSYNGTAVFTATPQSVFLSDGASNSTIQTSTSALSSALLGLAAGTQQVYSPAVNASGQITAAGNPSAGETITVGATAYQFVNTVTAAGQVLINANSVASTMQNLANAINDSGGTNGAGGNYDVAAANAAATATANDGVVTLTAVATGAAGNGATAVTDTATAPATVSGNLTLSGLVGGDLSGGTAAGTNTVQVNDVLTSAADAQTTLSLINTAIAKVASQRGNIGAEINRLQAASNVESVQVQNLTSAEDQIMAANIPQQVTNLSEYSILNQSGISALAQANSAQQSILKLLQ